VPASQAIPWDVGLVEGDFPAEDLKPGGQVFFRETSTSTYLLPGYVLKVNPKTVALVNALSGETRAERKSVSAEQVFVKNGRCFLRVDTTPKKPKFKLGSEGVALREKLEEICQFQTTSLTPYQKKQLNGEGGFIDLLKQKEVTPVMLDELLAWYEGNYWTGVQGQPLSVKILREGAGSAGPAWGQFMAQREKWLAEGKPDRLKKTDKEENTDRWERENKAHEARIPKSLSAWGTPAEKGVSPQ
jgi:hypothetical protein